LGTTSLKGRYDPTAAILGVRRLLPVAVDGSTGTPYAAEFVDRHTMMH
jgi:hypothetical protein